MAESCQRNARTWQTPTEGHNASSSRVTKYLLGRTHVPAAEGYSLGKLFELWVNVYNARPRFNRSRWSVILLLHPSSSSHPRVVILKKFHLCFSISFYLCSNICHDDSLYVYTEINYWSSKEYLDYITLHGTILAFYYTYIAKEYCQMNFPTTYQSLNCYPVLERTFYYFLPDFRVFHNFYRMQWEANVGQGNKLH